MLLPQLQTQYKLGDRIIVSVPYDYKPERFKQHRGSRTSIIYRTGVIEQLNTTTDMVSIRLLSYIGGIVNNFSPSYDDEYYTVPISCIIGKYYNATHIDTSASVFHEDDTCIPTEFTIIRAMPDNVLIDNLKYLGLNRMYAWPELAERINPHHFVSDIYIRPYYNKLARTSWYDVCIDISFKHRFSSAVSRQLEAEFSGLFGIPPYRIATYASRFVFYLQTYFTGGKHLTSGFNVGSISKSTAQLILAIFYACVNIKHTNGERLFSLKHYKRQKGQYIYVSDAINGGNS